MVAAQGLEELPSSPREWWDAIQRHGLQRRNLEQMCLEGSYQLLGPVSNFTAAHDSDPAQQENSRPPLSQRSPS